MGNATKCVGVLSGTSAHNDDMCDEPAVDEIRAPLSTESKYLAEFIAKKME